MRFKLVPEPPADLDRVREAQRAVPLVPGSEDDCCARLQRRLDFPSRDVSRTWLTFLRALGLAEETPSGFRRTATEPTPEHLRGAFLENVLLAERTLAALVEHGTGDDPQPLDADDVFERTREGVPQYERHKHPNKWEHIWRDRAANLLGWLALLDLAKPVSGDGSGGTSDGSDDAVDGGDDDAVDGETDAVDGDTGAVDGDGNDALGDPATAYLPTERGVACLD